MDSTTSELTLWQTVKGDFSRSAGLRVVGVALLLCWLAFQWGFGNDVLLPSIVANAFDAVDDGSSWGSGAAAVGAATVAGAGFWALTQMADAIITQAGLGLIPGITQRMSSYLRRKGWVKPYAELKWSTRWLLAYGTGVSVLCLVDRFATDTPGIHRRRHIIAMGTLLSAGSVGVVVALVTTAAMVATRIPATEDGAEIFIRYAKNPFVWIAIFVSVAIISKVRGNDSHGASPSTD